MNYTTLKTTSRQTKGTRENNRMRREGLIPGSVMKLDKTSVPISAKKSDLLSLLSNHGRAAVFKLGIDTKRPIFAMIRDIEVLPHTDNYLNLSLFEVSLKEEIKANVDFRIVNDESMQFAKLGITMYLKSLSVTGLPNDIPDYIDIDVSEMKNGDNILLKDLALPSNLATDVDMDTMVLSVISFRSAPADVPVDTQAEATDTVKEITE